MLKPLREHRLDVQNAVLPCRQSPHRRLPSGPPLGHPNSLKIALARAVCAKVRARAPLNAKKRTFGGPRMPKGAPMDPKWEQMGTQNYQKSQFFEKVPTVVWTHYLQYILTVGTLPNLTFSHLKATKMHVCSAWCLGCRPGAAKWRPRGRKMARVGSLGLPKGAKGAPNAS